MAKIVVAEDEINSRAILINTIDNKLSYAKYQRLRDCVMHVNNKQFVDCFSHWKDVEPHLRRYECLETEKLFHVCKLILQ